MIVFPRYVPFALLMFAIPVDFAIAISWSSVKLFIAAETVFDALSSIQLIVTISSTNPLESSLPSCADDRDLIVTITIEVSTLT